MKTVAVFPYTRGFDSDLGLVFKSKVTVTLVKGNRRIESITFLDSGADITVLPYRVGIRLGLQQENGSSLEFMGVGGAKFSVLVQPIGLKIGKSEILPVRVGWAQIEEVDMLLGRLDVFDHFTFEFNHAKQEIRVRQ